MQEALCLHLSLLIVIVAKTNHRNVVESNYSATIYIHGLELSSLSKCIGNLSTTIGSIQSTRSLYLQSSLLNLPDPKPAFATRNSLVWSHHSPAYRYRKGTLTEVCFCLARPMS